MINVTKTYLPSLEKYNIYLRKIFDKGIITNNGEMVRQLQKELKDYLGVKNILLVQNGTLALQIAYKLLKLKGKVITTPFSFVATVSSQVWQGLKPVFVDIDRESLNIDSKLIYNSMDSDVSAIVPVHVFGNSCNIEEIDMIANKSNVKVIYDAAHAFGVKYSGKSVLNYGDISVLSFHATKIFHTIEGGALVINDDELYENAKLMINFGISGVDKIDELGINAKMNELEAAMGLCILSDIDNILEQRKRVYEYYLNNIKGKVIFQKHNDKSTLNYSYFPVIFRNEATVINLIRKLQSENIKPRRYFYPCLSKLPYITNINKVDFAEDISKRILCLPFYDSLSINDLKKIIQLVNSEVN